MADRREKRGVMIKTGGNISSPLGFFRTVGNLHQQERRILSCIYREKRATLEQMAREPGIDPRDLAEPLRHLVALGIVFRYGFHNFEFYELNLREARFLTYERFPSGPVIPLIYHYNLLCNSARLDAFRTAIGEVVRPGDTVLDLGCGTGVLSIFAAQAGASYVYAVEVDPLVAEAADYFVKSQGFADRVKVVQKDVRNVAIGRVADVIICELLDTALIAELQVPVMNYAVESLLKKGGRVVPHSAVTSAELVKVDYSFTYGLQFPIVHYEAHGARRASLTLSEAKEYHDICFLNENPLTYDGHLMLLAKREGVANSLRLSTKTRLSPDIELEGSPWFNPPLVLPFVETKLDKDSVMEVNLTYGLGAGFSSIKYSVADKGGLKKQGRKDGTHGK
jgi:predicted RNA methylase